EGPHAAAVADQRELVLTYQLELLRGRRQRGARPVERAVAQYDPLGPPRVQDRLLEVPDRGYEPAYRARWRGVDRVLLALHRAARTRRRLHASAPGPVAPPPPARPRAGGRSPRSAAGSSARNRDPCDAG